MSHISINIVTTLVNNTRLSVILSSTKLNAQCLSNRVLRSLRVKLYCKVSKFHLRNVVTSFYSVYKSLLIFDEQVNLFSKEFRGLDNHERDQQLGFLLFQNVRAPPLTNPHHFFSGFIIFCFN